MQKIADIPPKEVASPSQSASSSKEPTKPHDSNSISEQQTHTKMSTDEKTPQKDHQKEKNTNRVSSVILLQLILGGCFFLMGIIYGWMHKIPDIITFIQGKGIEDYYEAIANFNFIGISENIPEPSIFAVMLEVGAWSFFGVLARSEYYLTQLVIQKKKIQILETISKIIGETAMGVFTAVAVVAFLWSTEFVNLTLRTADIGSIMAISFILGFYHENTRRLLGNFQKAVSVTSQEPKGPEEETGSQDSEKSQEKETTKRIPEDRITEQ